MQCSYVCTYKGNKATTQIQAKKAEITLAKVYCTFSVDKN